jgi:hypothetical protein
MAVTQAMNTPKISHTMVLVKASLLPPKAKKPAHAMVAAQIKNRPLNGPTARKVANPANTPILKESAVRLFIFNISKKSHLIIMDPDFIVRRFYESLEYFQIA